LEKKSEVNKSQIHGEGGLKVMGIEEEQLVSRAMENG